MLYTNRHVAANPESQHGPPKNVTLKFVDSTQHVKKDRHIAKYLTYNKCY
jgi:hypothetical protein